MSKYILLEPCDEILHRMVGDHFYEGNPLIDIRDSEPGWWELKNTETEEGKGWGWALGLGLGIYKNLADISAHSQLK